MYYMTLSTWAKPQPGWCTHACMRPVLVIMASPSSVSGAPLLYRRWRDVAAKLGGGGSAGRELGQLLQGIGKLLVSEEAAGQVCFSSGLDMVIGLGYFGHMLLELLVRVKCGARTLLDRLFLCLS